MHLPPAYSIAPTDRAAEGADRAWKLAALVLVLSVHVWLGWTLAHFRPHPPRTPTHSAERPSSTEPLLVLTFSSRVDAPRQTTARPAPTSRFRSRPAPGAPASPEAGGETAVPENSAPLRLSAPAAPKLKFARPDPLQRQAALSHEATRFDHAWVSEGTLTDVVARRSQIAGALLGALGALRKVCTQRQLEQYDPACVTDQYRHPDRAE